MFWIQGEWMEQYRVSTFDIAQPASMAHTVKYTLSLTEYESKGGKIRARHCGTVPPLVRTYTYSTAWRTKLAKFWPYTVYRKVSSLIRGIDWGWREGGRRVGGLYPTLPLSSTISVSRLSKTLKWKEAGGFFQRRSPTFRARLQYNLT